MSSIIVERLFWIHRFRILLWSFHARICRHIEYLTTPVFDKALFSTSAELQPIPSLHFRQTCYETNIVNEKMFSPIKNERNTSTFLPPSHHHHHTHTSVVLWSGCLIVRVTSSQFQTRQYKLSPPELLSCKHLNQSGNACNGYKFIVVNYRIFGQPRYKKLYLPLHVTNK